MIIHSVGLCSGMRLLVHRSTRVQWDVLENCCPIITSVIATPECIDSVSSDDVGPPRWENVSREIRRQETYRRIDHLAGLTLTSSLSLALYLSRSNSVEALQTEWCLLNWLVNRMLVSWILLPATAGCSMKCDDRFDEQSTMHSASVSSWEGGEWSAAGRRCYCEITGTEVQSTEHYLW